MYRSAEQTQSIHPVDTLPHLKEEIENIKSPSAAAFEVSISSIVPLRLPAHMQQPRLYFDAHKMELLKDSIHKHGVLEPVLLRPSSDTFQNQFELVSGERRWRCCQALGMTSIPAIVRQMSDSVALEAAIIAHLLSEEISLIEQTESILSLLSLQLNLSFEELKGLLYQVKNSRMRGIEQHRDFSERQIETISNTLSEFGMKLSSFVANRLPLLNLAPPVLASVRAGQLSPTNAVLINRQPQEFHESLIAQAEGKTKGELVALIRSVVPSDNQIEKIAERPSRGRKVSEQIYNRIKFVKKRTELLDNPDVLSRLAKIEFLLKEIESLDN